MFWFHIFFLIIMVLSIARVSINIMIFNYTLKDTHLPSTFLHFESYAIMTELASCLILFIYYRSVTSKKEMNNASGKADPTDL